MTARTQRTRGLAPPPALPFLFFPAQRLQAPCPTGAFQPRVRRPRRGAAAGLSSVRRVGLARLSGRGEQSEGGASLREERRMGPGEAESVEQGETGGQGAEARKQETEQQLTRTMELLKGESRLMAAAFSGGRGRELRACAGLTRCRDARLSRRFGRCWPCSCLARVVRGLRRSSYVRFFACSRATYSGRALLGRGDIYFLAGR